GHSLKDLLQVPKLRGSYGEEVLEEMLERVLPKGVWERQYVIDGREKVDVAIKYRDVVVPIDSKFPRDDYQRYLNSTTDEEKAQNWRN
ncbi:MAG: DNA recombination protein RmuC, partial [Dehalococcoidales bacterium]|nr:DNA recombination protein RmuC [Dehalococcoidales bacterium]